MGSPLASHAPTAHSAVLQRTPCRAALRDARGDLAPGRYTCRSTCTSTGQAGHIPYSYTYSYTPIQFGLRERRRERITIVKTPQTHTPTHPHTTKGKLAAFRTPTRKSKFQLLSVFPHILCELCGFAVNPLD